MSGSKTKLKEEEVKYNYITPALEKAGWLKNQIRMEYLTKGKIIIHEGKAKRENPKKADYVLFYKDNLPLAVVEAKSGSYSISYGMQQAKDYAERLNIRFAFSSNGKGFSFCDLEKGTEVIIPMDNFPSPEELYNKKYKEEFELFPNLKKIIETQYHSGEETHPPRYYQRVAINKTVEEVAKGKNKLLLVLATGTGKTYVAFQIIWRLWKSGIKKKILYLADRNILIDQTIAGDFKPFKNSLYKIEKRNMDTSYQIYLSLYQQLSESNEEDNLELLKRSFKPDFFDLIIVDECHRGSARNDSNWRKILEYFDSATKIGMTATPKETSEISNIDYFGEPIYTYSLKDGINDGYLAPFEVIRFNTNIDSFGYRPEKGKLDVEGNFVEDRFYNPRDINTKIVIEERDKLVAKCITDFLKKTDRNKKTIVFCVDIEHAERMRRALANENSDLCAKDSRYVMRITGDESTGKGELENFCDDDLDYPTIVTTSKLLTTGVNCRTCKVIVLDNNFGENGMTEFKQIIGRGTRIQEDKNKLYFTILDFNGASRFFADEKFNGPEIKSLDYDLKDFTGDGFTYNFPEDEIDDTEDGIETRKKIYVNSEEVKLVSEIKQYYDEEGKIITQDFKLFEVDARDYILKEFGQYNDFLNFWKDKDKRVIILNELENKGFFIKKIRELFNSDSSVDDFDLLCKIAYGMKPITRKERANKPKVIEILDQQPEERRKILEVLLEQYSNGNLQDFADENNLKLKEINNKWSIIEVIEIFGGKNNYTDAVNDIHNALYS